MIYFASSTGGFYSSDLHSEIPNDAVEISVAQHEALLVGLYSGRAIAVDAGTPTLVDRPSVEPSVAEIKARLAAVVQVHIDATARSKGYDSGLSCASYDGDPSPTFDAEAKVFKSWRSTVWTACYAKLAAVEAGTEEAPTADALIASLPAIAWPD